MHIIKSKAHPSIIQICDMRLKKKKKKKVRRRKRKEEKENKKNNLN